MCGTQSHRHCVCYVRMVSVARRTNSCLWRKDLPQEIWVFYISEERRGVGPHGYGCLLQDLTRKSRNLIVRLLKSGIYHFFIHSPFCLLCAQVIIIIIHKCTAPPFIFHQVKISVKQHISRHWVALTKLWRVCCTSAQTRPASDCQALIRESSLSDVTNLRLYPIVMTIALEWTSTFNCTDGCTNNWFHLWWWLQMSKFDLTMVSQTIYFNHKDNCKGVFWSRWGMWATQSTAVQCARVQQAIKMKITINDQIFHNDEDCN